MRKVRNAFVFCLIGIFSAIFLIPTILAAGSIPGIVSTHIADRPVVIQKAEQPLSPSVRSYLEARDGHTAVVWLFFTDKGVFSRSEFDDRSSEIVLTPKVLKRRAKVGLDHVTFADLPVNRSYINAVTNRGGKLRRISRWLNAASFEIPVDRLDEISALPSVAYVKPVMKFKRDPVAATEVKLEPSAKQPLDKRLVDPLDYGFSEDQLNQISVPPVHAQGYNGEGVTLAILDTGFRKSHEAFAQHYAEGRVLAEWDFINDDDNTANEVADGDVSSQWNHGTYIWSTSAGYKDGAVYGPAYKANFLLAKTEDVRSETPVEEDNWVAALEWAESLGADVLTSSLAYLTWDIGSGTSYTYEDLDGATATTSIAASMAAGMGIVVCNAMANSGPDIGTLHAPADAFDILAVGAVASNDYIASFSSRGPTSDGRPKPEVCARGVATACATASDDNTYGAVNGTSLSTPLVAGAACVLIQARPNLSPYDIRLALMETASMADSPDSTTYGHGIINLLSATGWGANFVADQTMGDAPLTVQFTASSNTTPNDWIWSFGDGGSAFVQNPTHEYTSAGVFDVALTIQTDTDTITQFRSNYIIALGDTLSFRTDSAYAGNPFSVSVDLANYQPLKQIVLPFHFGDEPSLRLDSVTRGERTGYFETLVRLTNDPDNNLYTYILKANNGGGAPPLGAGAGEILQLHCTLDSMALGGLSNYADSGTGGYGLEMQTEFIDQYVPIVLPGTISTRYVVRGDANANDKVNIADISYLVTYMFGIPPGTPPVTIQGGDANGSLKVNVTDISYLIAYLFGNGPAPPQP
ncbi:MAG: S8 family serine peptidase [candidate division Zixibacteria bacterium]|nr:S8 family serine peptidase [candidate division Zixibacteria bacterium]